MELADLSRLKSTIESIRAEIHRAQGALDSALLRLQEEYGCQTAEEAEAKLSVLRRKKERKERILRKALDAFDKEQQAWLASE